MIPEDCNFHKYMTVVSLPPMTVLSAVCFFLMISAKQH
jgi:hypothetical protein